jgi:hypothetical protein
MDDLLAPLIGQVVVADLADWHVVIGTLAAVQPDGLVLVDADLHDQREGNATKEVYCLETRSLGVRANRRRVVIPRRQVVAVCLLCDICG